jgi:hypothetical protein
MVTLSWVKYIKFFVADSDPGAFRPWIRERKNWVREKHSGSATLAAMYGCPRTLPFDNLLSGCFSRFVQALV